MSDDDRARVIAAGYVPALWVAPDQRYLPPNPPPRTVSLAEALAEIDTEEADDE